MFHFMFSYPTVLELVSLPEETFGWFELQKCTIYSIYSLILNIYLYKINLTAGL